MHVWCTDNSAKDTSANVSSECEFGAIEHNYEIMRGRSFCIQDGVWLLQLEKKKRKKKNERKMKTIISLFLSRIRVRLR